MDRLFKISLFAFCAFWLYACAPLQMTSTVETRYPSSSGMNLYGKNLAIVYFRSPSGPAVDFAENIASSLAYSLEEDYGGGENSVGVYSLDFNSVADYAGKEAMNYLNDDKTEAGTMFYSSLRDSLNNLIIDTGSDVVFLLDSVDLSVVSYDSLKFSGIYNKDSAFVATAGVLGSFHIFCLDGMDKEEDVKIFGGKNVVKQNVYLSGNEDEVSLLEKTYASLDDAGWKFGDKISKSFVSRWRREDVTYYYFDNEDWLKGLRYARYHQYSQAMDVWLSLVSSSSASAKGCASYNMAVTCYILGEYDLALQWLDMAAKYMDFKNVDTFRAHIESRRQ